MWSLLLHKQIGEFVSISTCGRIGAWISNPIYLWINGFFLFISSDSLHAPFVKPKNVTGDIEEALLVKKTKPAFLLDSWRGRNAGGGREGWINKEWRHPIYHTGSSNPDNRQSVTLFIATGQLPWINVLREETKMYVSECVCGSFLWLIHFDEFH